MFVFHNSMFYLLKFEPNMFVTYLLYFGYMGIICIGFFLMTGER
jgi:hypothetical protein